LCDSAPRGALRWLHLNLVNQGTRIWIESASDLPAGARELLLSPDTHQRSLVEGETVCCILHDLERDFDVQDTARVGALRVAITPHLIVTTRLHPLGSADIVRQRISDGYRITGPASALDLIVSALCQNIGAVLRALSTEVQAAEDAFLEGHPPPTSRALLDIRRRLAQIHRMLDGSQRVFRRLEQDEDLPEALLPAVEKLSQRLQGLDADAIDVQGQLRLLRDELDLQSDHRTNQNLYLLSVMTALLLPATLVTGLFGMNTGDLPFTGPHGTLIATLIAAGTALATYIFLRRKGFFR
jgi:zinc transporter